MNRYRNQISHLCLRVTGEENDHEPEGEVPGESQGPRRRARAQAAEPRQGQGKRLVLVTICCSSTIYHMYM